MIGKTLSAITFWRVLRNVAHLTARKCVKIRGAGGHQASLAVGARAKATISLAGGIGIKVAHGDPKAMAQIGGGRIDGSPANAH